MYIVIKQFSFLHNFAGDLGLKIYLEFRKESESNGERWVDKNGNW